MAYRSMLTEGWYDSTSYPRDGTCFQNAEMSVQRVGSIIGYFMIYVARTDVKNAVSIILGGMAYGVYQRYTDYACLLSPERTCGLCIS